MAVKFYSDLTHKMYESLEELEKAEKEVAAASDARKVAAKKVQDAATAVTEARSAYEKAKEDYYEEVRKFNQSFGPYKTSVKADEIRVFDDSLSDLLNFAWRFGNF